MFFRWKIPKSAEEMVSRWAVKRVCKFILKKKLGQFILGDIDLDQLDVQLSDGSIQLNDLALNVEYLNQKFGAATSLIIKEGSIGSLLVKMPWKGKGCQVEVDELELVLAPCQDNNSQDRDESCSTSQDGNDNMQQDSGQFGLEMGENPYKFTPNEVHEGVKIIAKMVKWFLTSFHVKIKKLIVAFDPCMEKDGNKLESKATLVLRISEIECGTCVSEDDALNSDARAENFLGIGCLTNFVKFQGAILELLHADAFDHQADSPRGSGTSFAEVPSDCSPLNATTPIMTRKMDGFSGNIKLSIPWKDGSLDIRKVDADVYIDPIELTVQPSTIRWFLLSWETYNKFDEDRRAHMLYKPSDSVYFNTSSHFQSPTNFSAATAADEMKLIHGSCSTDFTSLNGQECASETMLSDSRLIVDWVPFPVNKNQKDAMEEVDLGASVDQFFECFDGMRHSQSALGNSGMWNWTCSVFSAITAASSLASGSLNIPSEQQHAQTNLKAVFAGISIVFSFYDEDQRRLYHLKSKRMDVGPCVHYLGAECRDISLVVQVCPDKMRYEGTMKYMEIADYFRNEIDAMNFHSNECKNNDESQTISFQQLQSEVECVLPPFARSSKVHDSDEFDQPFGAHSSFGNKDDAVKLLLLRTSGTTNCQFTIGANQSRGSLKRSMLFSLKLPPFFFWVDFHLINMLWNMCKEVGSSAEITQKKTEFLSEMINEKHASSYRDVKRGSCPPITTLSSTETLRGNISIPDARVILCFPFNRRKDIGGHFPWDQFIALDFSAPPTLKKGVVQEPPAASGGSFEERLRAVRSLHLNVGELNIYLVTSAYKADVGINSCCPQRSKFSAQNILSLSNRNGLLSVFSMIWQEGPVTGPWIVERAKSLATFEESRSRNKFMGKGSEFAAANRVNDLEDTISRTRQEIILNSAFLVHICIFTVKIDLDSSQFSCLLGLLNQITSGLSCVAHDGIGDIEEYAVSQTSILLECDSMELVIRPDIKENLKGSLQSELPGSWHCLKLGVQKFNLLSVSNIGGIKDAGFFWVAHDEGTLWGCVSGVPSQQFLLISCSNSTMKRGDGGGSNALSSRLAGSDIVHMWEPETFHGFTSVTVRCGTIVAVGGRLDWLDAITSFFSLSSQVEEADENGLQKGDLTVPSRASFTLNLVDVGLSYEPYFMKLIVQSEVLDSFFSSTGTSGPRVACLLAASSLILSNTTVANSMENDYKIRLKDLGLLLCAVSEPEKLRGTYSVQHLQGIGYIKVAQEALLEAVLRTNCKNSLLWELECSNSHVYVDTCHDTTSALISLAAQLQQLFAPDMEESLVHLQDRYDSLQQAQERNDCIDAHSIVNSDSARPSQMHTSTTDTRSETRVVGLMDEISEDAFHFDGSQTCQLDSSESQFHISVDDDLHGEACNLAVESLNVVAADLSVNGLMPLIGLEGTHTSFLQNGCLPEFIEGYCLADMCPLSELSVGRQSLPQMRKCRSLDVRDGDLVKESSGWYGDACLRIVENHLSETCGETSIKNFLECKLPSIDCPGPGDLGKAVGSVLLKNINVKWRMYSGSDWHDSRNNGLQSPKVHRRDTTVCLELALSGMQFQYDVFPIGGMFVSKLSLSVQDFHLYDRSRNAPWKLVLGYYDSKDRPRESSSNAFKLDLEAVRPNPQTPLEEYRLRVAMLPMLLHLHQSQLDFLIEFFGEKGSSVDESPRCHNDSYNSKSLETKFLTGRAVAAEALLPYFQKFDIWPVLVRVDYCPNRVDLAALRGGKYVELVNLVPWKGVELKLKHVHAVGIYGWSGVCETIMGEWLEDISQNQIHKVLRGLPTIRSLVAVGSGAAKLVSLPVENYRKDKRVFKGVQRGIIAFLRSISLEAVGLGVHLAAGAHDILFQAEYILTSIPPSVSWPVQDNTKTNVRCNQPKDTQQGIQQACESLSDGLGRSASALVRTPLKKYQRGASAGSALATALRGVPAAAIAPASACASAIQYALLGLRNSLDPELKKESMEKYLGPSQSQEQD